MGRDRGHVVCECVSEDFFGETCLLQCSKNRDQLLKKVLPLLWDVGYKYLELFFPSDRIILLQHKRRQFQSREAVILAACLAACISLPAPCSVYTAVLERCIRLPIAYNVLLCFINSISLMPWPKAL